ncbi:insulin-like isoform X2 [Stegodyphus dumicola]|uniref:insulin-like isoform X2 n=1 Tax=Stegodyphus dumicola TaxID=202533 RepID=UPI0015ACB498|nr:insulin-like isoform X2 [Stegodyphus dumicola]
MLRQHLILLSFGIVALSALQADGIESVRLCGRRLADALSVVCKTYGGYQLPRVRKDVSNRSSNKRAMIEILRPMMRRTTHSEIENDFSGDSATEVDLTPSSQSGVANECCKRPCTLRTMASYCADATDIGNLDINEIWRPEVVSEEDLAEYELQQESIAFTPEYEDSRSTIHASNGGPLSYPNLGLSTRNRPVFIVLSKQPEYYEDKAAGEYRF